MTSKGAERKASETLKEEHGRIVTALQETYFLPADEPEWQRLNTIHEALKLVFDGLYPAANIVDALLKNEDGGSERKRILDIGSGSGAWALDMAIKFPHCDVLGIDLAPYALKPEQIPPNLRFECYDINDGLQHLHSRYDLIHMRQVGSGIKDFAKTRLDIEECLKPRGMVLFIDGDWWMYAEDRVSAAKLVIMDENGFGDKLLNKSEQRSWLRTIFHVLAQLIGIVEVRAANEIAGADVNGVEYVSDHGVWDHPLIDQDTAISANLFVPVGALANHPDPKVTKRLHDIGRPVCEAFMNVQRAFHPALLRHGVSQKVLDHWAEMTDDDLITMNPPVWIRYAISWGRRGTEKPKGQSSLTSSSSDAPAPTAAATPDTETGNTYPYFYVFKTKAATEENIKLRAAHRGKDETPFVESAWRKMRESIEG